ncbi:MAG: hypothetical protein D4R81_09505 [Nitrospiraceae bacterium]|nr:MAG: hypothetical protein D4R81_09505 [Nitrospiraceae bacterium]
MKLVKTAIMLVGTSNERQTMRKILGIVCVVLALFMVPVAQATTINFEDQGPVTAFYPGPQDGIHGIYRTFPQSLSSWSLEQGTGGNTSMEVVARIPSFTNQSVNLVTYTPSSLLPHQPTEEFTFKGVDIYHENTTPLQVDILGYPSFDANVPRFSLGVSIQPGSGWFHYDLDTMNIPININGSSLYAHNVDIGALSFFIGHVTNTPEVVVGFDNIRVCQTLSLTSCTYDAPISFNPSVPSGIPPVDPIVTTTVTDGAVPEPSTWWYLILAAGIILGVRKFAYV